MNFVRGTISMLANLGQTALQPGTLYTVGQKKTAPLYFRNNFVKTFNSEMIIYWYTSINLEQIDIKIINLS